MAFASQRAILLRRVPRPPLDRYVARLWYSAGHSVVHKLERVLPTATVQLVIRLHQDRIRRYDDHCRNELQFEHAVISGAHCQPFIKATYQPSSVIGVHFRPAGAALFFGEPFSRLKNLSIAAEGIWGADICQLRERLLEADSPGTMFDLLENALLLRLVEPSDEWHAVSWAVSQFIAAPATTRVLRVSDSTGYSPRRFIRLFEDHVGLTPKMFCRVLRFQAVLERVARGDAVDWANIAVDCGYYDQSHLIRDFRAFSGSNPSEYRPADPDRRNHVAVHP